MNHDVTKIPVDNPLVLNLSLIFGFTFLTLITLKKTVNDKPLSILQSNQMKGLAIIIIILFHLSIHTLAKPSDLPFFKSSGFKAVALFLILSGFGLTISMQKKGINNFFSKRFTKVYIPFLFAMLLEIFLNQSINNNPHILTELYNAFFNVSILNSHMWFIVFILLWYIVIYLLFYLNLSNKSKIFLLCLVSVCILVASEPSKDSALFLCKINAFSFPLGCLLGLNYENIKPKIDRLLKQNLLIIIGIIVSCFVLSKFFGNLASALGKQGIVANYILLGIIVIAVLLNLVNRQLLRKNIIEVMLALSVLVMIAINYFNLSSYYSIAVNILINTSAILAAFAIFLLISIMLRFQVYSLFINGIGDISFELYLLHGMFMYPFDFILFRGNINITFFIYFLFICLISMLFKKLTSTIYNLTLSKLNKLEA
ncbi:acyltransferase [Nostoc sp. UHCC 0302]|uniref:acyltransferase n=1 Tax=Nostoc sp. UHCC 0302 TaxID=3134896 RepID=UPI00311CC368